MKPLVTAQSWRLLDLYDHYKSGYLAITGGLLDQPAGYLDAMKLIGNLFNKAD